MLSTSKEKKRPEYIPKHFLLHIVLLVLSGLLWIQASNAAKLYVFYPIPINSQAMQKNLSQICPDIEVTVFGMYRDFEARIKSNPPDAVLTKLPVINKIKGFAVALKGGRKGKTKEPYILLSVDKRIDPNKIENVDIGAFDILGRAGMDEFVSDYFTCKPKIRRVSKMEDLLSLLTFNMVKAIIVPEYYIDYFNKKSKLDFICNPVPKMHVEIISLAVRDEKDIPLLTECLRGFNDNLMALFGIDAWE